VALQNDPTLGGSKRNLSGLRPRSPKQVPMERPFDLPSPSVRPAAPIKIETPVITTTPNEVVTSHNHPKKAPQAPPKLTGHKIEIDQPSREMTSQMTSQKSALLEGKKSSLKPRHRDLLVLIKETLDENRVSTPLGYPKIAMILEIGIKTAQRLIERLIELRMVEQIHHQGEKYGARYRLNPDALDIVYSHKIENEPFPWKSRLTGHMTSQKDTNYITNKNITSYRGKSDQSYLLDEVDMKELEAATQSRIDKGTLKCFEYKTTAELQDQLDKITYVLTIGSAKDYGNKLSFAIRYINEKRPINTGLDFKTRTEKEAIRLKDEVSRLREVEREANLNAQKRGLQDRFFFWKTSLPGDLLKMKRNKILEKQNPMLRSITNDDIRNRTLDAMLNKELAEEFLLGEGEDSSYLESLSSPGKPVNT